MPESDVAWQLATELVVVTNKIKRPIQMPARVHAAFVMMIDRDVGALMDLLTELEIEDDTMLIFCSDNGPDDRYEGELNSAGAFRGFKGSLFEGGLRVPLIMRWTGQIGPAQVCSVPSASSIKSQ